MDPKHKAFIHFFEDISSEIHQNAVDHGWWDSLTPEEFAENNFDDIDDDEPAFTKNDVIDAFMIGKRHPERNEGELLMLTVSEIAEGLEGLRGDLDSDHIEGFKMIEEEMADAIIRLCDHAYKFDYRLPQAIIAKMEFNQTREYKHGGKRF